MKVLLLLILVMSPRAEPVFDRIVFLGDSLTEMGDLDGGWIQNLRGKFDNVYNRGFSGDKLSDLLARVYTDTPTHSRVVVFIGTNDVWDFLVTPKDKFKEDLTTLVKKLIASGNDISLCTLGVIGEKKVNPLDQKLDEFSDIIRRVGADFNLSVCDIRRAFLEYLKSNNPEDKEVGILTSDGVHLSAEGNRIVADEIKKLLMSD